MSTLEPLLSNPCICLEQLLLNRRFLPECLLLNMLRRLFLCFLNKGHS